MRNDQLTTTGSRGCGGSLVTFGCRRGEISVRSTDCYCLDVTPQEGDRGLKLLVRRVRHDLVRHDALAGSVEVRSGLGVLHLGQRHEQETPVRELSWLSGPHTA